MKKLFLILLLLSACCFAKAQNKPFRFAFISDTHIGSPNGLAEEDLRRTVRDINQMEKVDFVVITGDITELGTNEELRLAKQILDSLRIPYYIIPGNHDTGWSESGGDGFIKTFGNDKFRFDFNGIRFLGCASGPYVRMSDGHVPKSHILWLEDQLKQTPVEMPVIFLNHYPIDNSLDNWYEVIDRLKTKKTIAILCGHGHVNKQFSFEEIPGVMGRSNLRARAAVGGYNLVDVATDSIIFSERRPLQETLAPWARVRISKQSYSITSKFSRPDYNINTAYGKVKEKWTFQSSANVISTPVVADGLVIFGNQLGIVEALSIKNGESKWLFKTKGGVFSSPAFSKGSVVFGSADGNIYCLDAVNGKLQWKYETNAAVLGSPVIKNDLVFIGGSDHHFRAFALKSGKPVWQFEGLKGPVVSTPLLYENKLIVGAWDTYLYALSETDGKLLWKWNPGSAIVNYSPASCIPVAKDGIVYVVTPDRFLSAIDVNDGKTLWRNNEARVRESIGISNDGKYVYGKTMQDTIVAFPTSREYRQAAWKMHCSFGYEHVPSMLIEKNGQVFFGTRNGLVYAIDPKNQQINWIHKIDNSMVNTVNVLDDKQLVIATMDGKLVLLQVE